MILAVLVGALTNGTGEPQHHGFFLRMDLGFGYHSSTSPGAANDFTGPGGAFGIAIGGNVADNLALFGQLVGGGTTANDPSATMSAVGIGLTYYLMPANVFVSAATGFGGLTLRQMGYAHRTDTGVMARVGLGKEWFVSESWGLGVAAYVDFNSARDSGTAAMWTTYAPLVAFSATFY